VNLEEGGIDQDLAQDREVRVDQDQFPRIEEGAREGPQVLETQGPAHLLKDALQTEKREKKFQNRPMEPKLKHS
jgi:hypothetical protein